MSEAKFIDRTTPPSPGLDYLALRDQGLKVIQQLAGEVWTDYNEHDPGVTVLEQLCYALTELSYRAELPIEDLLADPETHAIDPVRQVLLAPELILPCSPITADDYRRLIVDGVASVGNVWSRAHESREPGAVNGLYDIDIYVPPAASGPAQQQVIEQVRRTYAAARGLCEDLHFVHVLELVPTTLAASVLIEPSAAAESIAARILYRVSCLLAPEVRRSALDAAIEGDLPPAGVLCGPLPRRGLVADAGPQTRPERFTIGEVSRVIREIPGVAGVQSVRVSARGASMDTSGVTSTIPVPAGGILQLDTGGSEVRIFRGAVECRLKLQAIQRELSRLWFEHRREFDTRDECRRLFAFPQASAPVDVKTYELLQHQFPGVYGINERGVPSDATDMRRAQARQLQAFLLPFEQLLADGFARLASSAQGASRSRVYQYLDAAFPEEVAPLLKGKRSYRSAVRTMESGDRAADRLWRARQAMLAAYAETAEPLAAPETSVVDANDDVTRVRSQVGFLRNLPEIGARRGTGFDYSAEPEPGNVSGVEIRTRLQLGLRPGTPAPFEETLRRFGLSELPDAPPVADRALMMQHGRAIEESFKPIPQLFEPPDPSITGSGTLSEELLIAASAPDHYRIGALPGDDQRTVVCRAPSQTLWQLVGKYEDEHVALGAATSLLSTARGVYRQARRLYLIEHPLLRFAPAAPGDDVDLSFTASAVVCVPVRDAFNRAYRERVCSILRSNTPAHVVVHGCFLRFSRICAFEALYWRWREALRTGQEREEACRKLRDFLRPDLL